MNTGLLIFLLVSLAGMASCCAGVYLLLGPGWALLALGGSCFAVAGFIRKGLISG
jgi:hypothetical protein